jgi:gas vesicle protein
MRRFLAFIGGALSGGVIGTALALLFTPQSGGSMREGLRERYRRAVEAGQQAAIEKRAELEARLVELTGVRPAEPSESRKLPSGNGRK